MRLLTLALAALLPAAALPQHEGHVMPPAKPAVKKQAASKAVVKKSTKKRTVKAKKKATANKSTATKSVPRHATKKAASKAKSSANAHQGHVPAATTKKATPAVRPKQDLGHDGHTGKAPQKPVKTPATGHDGHGGAPPAGGKAPVQKVDPHQGHGSATPAPAKSGATPTQGHEGHGGAAPQNQEFRLPPPRTQPNLNKEGWPKPVMDNETYGLSLFERLEFLPSRQGGDLAWDFVGWRGGDYRRIWFKSEGEQALGSSGEGEADLEVHYGRLVAPFFDLLTGVRVEQQWGGRNKTRISLGVGLQGVAPYVFDTEAFVFLSQNGRLSFNGTFTRDVYLAQKLILQPRIEANLSLQSDRDFGVGSGLNDLDLSVRLRYELRREIAPYVGVSWRQQFGQTASYARASGDDVSRLRLVFGVRFWF